MSDEDLLAFNSSLFDEDEDDFFGMQLDPSLSAFCESIESTDIDQLISTIEETDKFEDFDLNFSLFDGLTSLLDADFNTPQERRRSSSSVTTIKVDNKSESSRCSNWKVKQETKYVSSCSVKKVKSKKKKVTGISLLAKPPKVTKVKKQINDSRICPTRFAAYFYQTHDYCSNPNKAKTDSPETSSLKSSQN